MIEDFVLVMTIDALLWAIVLIPPVWRAIRTEDRYAVAVRSFVGGMLVVHLALGIWGLLVLWDARP